jgi:hypothetical protein
VEQGLPSSRPSTSVRVSISSWPECPASAFDLPMSKTRDSCTGARTEEDEMVPRFHVPHQQPYLLALRQPVISLSPPKRRFARRTMLACVGHSPSSHSSLSSMYVISFASQPRRSARARA